MTHTSQPSVPLKVFGAKAALAGTPSTRIEKTWPAQPRSQAASLAGLVYSVHRANRSEDAYWLSLALSALAVLALSFWI